MYEKSDKRRKEDAFYGVLKARMPELGQRHHAGESLRSLAKELGIQGRTLRVWFEEAGIEIKKFKAPKKYSQDIRDKISEAYSVGKTWAEIKFKFNCGAKIINRVIDENSSLKRHSASEVCRFLGCSEPSDGEKRAYCKLHSKCSVANCPNAWHVDGICSTHKRRLDTTGTVGEEIPVKGQKPKGVPCEVEGCIKLSAVDGLCHMHYRRRAKTGEVGLPESSRGANGTGCITSSGYVSITVSRKTTAEHIYNMELHLGRKLLDNETVHHKHGERAMNCIKWLELWSKAQPYGQRLKDKLAFWRWALETYKDLEEKLGDQEVDIIDPTCDCFYCERHRTGNYLELLKLPKYQLPKKEV